MMTDLGADEKRELAELRELKKELAQAGWANKKVTRDNLLMKKMGAELPYRYDPLPPAIYLAIYRDETNPGWLRALAWVLMNTIAIGRNSPWAVDEYDRSLDVTDMAAALGWGKKWAEENLLDLETRGFVKRDPPIWGKTREKAIRRIHLNAYNAFASSSPFGGNCFDDSKGDAENAEGVHPPPLSPPVRLEPYIKKQLARIAPAIVSEALVRHTAIQEFGGLLETDAIAGARTIREQLEYSNWTWAGVKLRDKRKTRAHPAQPSLLDPLKVRAGYVQLDLALDLPEGVRIPVATNGTVHQEASQHPTLPLEEVVQAPEPASPAEKMRRDVHAKNGVYETPATLLSSPTLQSVVSTSVEIRNAGASKHGVSLPAEDQSQTPSMRAAMAPKPTGKPRDAIPATQPDEKRPAAPEKPAPAERTGLVGAPSIEHRKRLHEIALAIPDQLAERLHASKNPALLRKIDEALRGSPVEPLAASILEADARDRFKVSLGLCINLADDIGKAWTAGAAKRELEAKAAEAAQKADEAARRREAEEQAAAVRKRRHLLAHPEDCPYCVGRGRYSTDALPAGSSARGYGRHLRLSSRR